MHKAQCVMRNVKIFVFAVFVLLINFSVASAAQSVTDQTGHIRVEEVELLNQKISAIESAHKIKIGVVIVKSLNGRDIVAASDELLDKNFANSINGSIVLLVDDYNRKYEISTNERMMQRITNHDGIPFLAKKFKPSLSAKNYYVAANDFVDAVNELVTYYETNGVAYGQQSREGFDQVAAVIAAVTAILFGVMIRSSLIGSMSNIRHAMEAIDYLKKNSVKLTESRDTFLFTNIQRRPRGGGGKRSGGGGHSSGHGGGGGSF